MANDSLMLALILRAQLTDWQVKPYYKKGYFEQFHPDTKEQLL